MSIEDFINLLFIFLIEYSYERKLTNVFISVINSRLTIKYGTNSTLIQSLYITACLCTNNGTCDFERTTTLSPHYKLAACNCPDQYNGMFNKYK